MTGSAAERAAQMTKSPEFTKFTLSSDQILIDFMTDYLTDHPEYQRSSDRYLLEQFAGWLLQRNSQG